MAWHVQIPAALAPLVYRAIHLGARFIRPMIMGVRGIAFDPAGRVLLVRHSYIPGWHFPGGGVEPGETLRQALGREMSEEAAVEILGEPRLHGIFFNTPISRRDHIAVFVIDAWRQTGPRPADWEIVETGFFDPAALPAGTTPATRRRLKEILEGGTVSELW